jgi:hypothetical protein
MRLLNVLSGRNKHGQVDDSRFKMGYRRASNQGARLHARMANFARLPAAKTLSTRSDHGSIIGCWLGSRHRLGGLRDFLPSSLNRASNFGSEGRKNRRTATMHGGGRDVATAGPERSSTTRDFDSGAKRNADLTPTRTSRDYYLIRGYKK